jgi:crotonobetainyl-CoA:carnitine CoA-transferase CaiB-like acyl-CoA transferase
MILKMRQPEAGLVFAKVRTFEEFSKEPQYTEVLSGMPLITVEKIGESEPVPFRKDAKTPLDGIRAMGMGHVIAGAGMGRDLAFFGADVLNIWHPGETEIEGFAWDVQVGMRQTILDYSKDDSKKFDHLLEGADVFFSNKRPGYLERHGFDAKTLSEKKPGLIHASVFCMATRVPWKNRPGFDEVGGAVAGLFTIEGTPEHPQSPPIIPIADNVVGWLGTIGILSALRRRAVEGGSYKVTVSLTRTVLWLMSLGIFDKSYAKATGGSSDEHAYIAPDLFTAETPLGTYQGITEQVYCQKTPGHFNMFSYQKVLQRLNGTINTE